MLLLNVSSKHKRKCCRPSSGLHIHKDGCKAPNDKFSHHHHHQHEHKHQHQNDHHCCSDKQKVMSQPHKCASPVTVSKCQSSPAISGLCGHAMHSSIMESHAQCKVHVEFHEPKHCHQGRCDKNQDGVHLHDVKNPSCLGSHNLDLPPEEKVARASNSIGNCLEHTKSPETVHCHNGNYDIASHGRPSPISPCYLNSSASNDCQQFGCENTKCHSIGHQNTESHSEPAKKHQEDHVCVDIDDEHVESNSMQTCVCSEEKETRSCHKGYAEECEASTVVCTCENSNDRQVGACCVGESSSKKSTDFAVVNACVSLDKRESGSCCKSRKKECCGKHEHLHAGFVAGLSDIIIE